MLDIHRILDLIPHRYPFLLVDRVLEIEAGKRIVGIKNVTINEPFFQGHFPGRPIMPGVLIAEAMAQVAGIMILSLPEARGKLALLAGIEKIRFRRPVFPGDQLRLEAETIRIRARVGTFNARALVGDQVVAEGEFLYSVVDAIE